MKSLLRVGPVVLVVAGVLVGCQSMYSSSGGGPSGSGSGAGDFLQTGRTSSFFAAIQVDPKSEDSAGPQFVAAGDLNGDGWMDLVSAWNESQPVQAHFQQRDSEGNIRFLTLPLGGTTPIAQISGLDIADVDGDENPDVIVLVRDTGTVATCDPKRPDCDPTDNNGVIDGAIMGVVVVLFAPDDPVNEVWHPVELAASRLAGESSEGGLPEDGGYSGLAVGDVDGANGPDIIVAFNSAEGEPKLNSIDLYPNPGPASARDLGSWLRTTIHADLPMVKDVEVLDVERDGDLDVVCTYPDAKSLNVRWLVNPLDGGAPGDILTSWGPAAPIGQIYTGADALTLGDVDGDGITDVVVRSTNGMLVQWFKGPNFPSYDFIRNPWQVYTLAEFISRAPGAVALGDLNGNGLLDAAIGAEGALAWFAASTSSAVFEQWDENLIVDDSPEGSGAGRTPTPTPTSQPTDLGTILQQLATDPQASAEASTGTFINAVVIVDLDGDGDDDIIATLDRRGASGLTNDALVWFRNGLGG